MAKSETLGPWEAFTIARAVKFAIESDLISGEHARALLAKLNRSEKHRLIYIERAGSGGRRLTGKSPGRRPRKRARG